MILHRRLLLASASPRRRQLLASLDAETVAIPVIPVDEKYPADMPATEVPRYLACLKRDAYDRSMLGDNDVLVTADTVVIAGDEILGKPADKQDACRMLSTLSGHTHRVVTGVTLTSRRRSVDFASTTLVTFDELTPDEISYYVDNYNPVDKAGAYGIQEWIGYIGVKSITGDYYNVMGLPLHDLYKHLKRF